MGFNLYFGKRDSKSPLDESLNSLSNRIKETFPLVQGTNIYFYLLTRLTFLKNCN